MDLIYEGITTNDIVAKESSFLVRMDLIYEGITTLYLYVTLRLSLCQNGPDLRRDYDMT